MNLLDYILIGILVISALVGFKKGFISSLVAFVGTLLVIIIAFYLKNPVSSLLYNNLPFMSLNGMASGVSIINILIYEGISYVITLIILSIIIGIIIKISGIFSKIINASVVFTMPSKLLGLVCGLIEGIVISFIISFILSLVVPTSSIVCNSKYSKTLITKTPLLSDYTKKTYKSVNEIYNIIDRNNSDTNQSNLEALDVLLKYEILNSDSALNLLNKGKIKIAGAEEVILKYKKKGDIQ